MEIVGLHNWQPWNDLDYDRDPYGVVAEKDVICGYCHLHMTKAGSVYRCPRCGQIR